MDALTTDLIQDPGYGLFSAAWVCIIMLPYLPILKNEKQNLEGMTV